MPNDGASEDLILKRLETLKAAKITAANFCVYRERTQQEVFDRLKKMGLSDDETNEIICELIQENFINEERFAKAFVGGKFRIKKWGRKKILYHLKQKGLSEYCIRKGLEEIEEDSYLELIDKLIESKDNALVADSDYERFSKITNYLINKGFETEIARERVNYFMRDRA